MRSPATDPVQRVVRYALRLRARLERGERLSLVHQQAVLTNLVLEVDGGHAEDRGARYALVCWLDELFTCRSRWADQWNEQKLESALYGANDRAWEFWRQAKLAEAQPEDYALRAYFLCVALGFRGQLRSDQRELEEWFGRTRSRVARLSDEARSAGVGSRRRGPRALRGASRMRRLVATAAVVLLCLAPLATYAIVQRVLT